MGGIAGLHEPWFSFSYTSLPTYKVRELSLPYYLPIALTQSKSFLQDLNSAP